MSDVWTPQEAYDDERVIGANVGLVGPNWNNLVGIRYTYDHIGLDSYRWTPELEKSLDRIDRMTYNEWAAYEEEFRRETEEMSSVTLLELAIGKENAS